MPFFLYGADGIDVCFNRIVNISRQSATPNKPAIRNIA